MSDEIKEIKETEEKSQISFEDSEEPLDTIEKTVADLKKKI